MIRPLILLTLTRGYVYYQVSHVFCALLNNPFVTLANRFLQVYRVPLTLSISLIIETVLSGTGFPKKSVF